MPISVDAGNRCACCLDNNCILIFLFLLPLELLGVLRSIKLAFFFFSLFFYFILFFLYVIWRYLLVIERIYVCLYLLVDAFGPYFLLPVCTDKFSTAFWIFLQIFPFLFYFVKKIPFSASLRLLCVKYNGNFPFHFLLIFPYGQSSNQIPCIYCIQPFLFLFSPFCF